MDRKCGRLGIDGTDEYGRNDSNEQREEAFCGEKEGKVMTLPTSPHELIESKISVLLVESADEEAAALESILLQCSYNVKRMKSVSDALEWLKACDSSCVCNLILLDIFRPDYGGLELLKKITSSDLHNSIPVVMMGSEESVEMSIKCIGSGACDYLIKPLRKNELLNLWQHVWRKSVWEGDYFVGSNNGQGSGSGSRGGSAGGSDNDVDNLEQGRFMNEAFDNGNANGSSDGNSEKGSHKRSSANGESNNVESDTSRQMGKTENKSESEPQDLKRQKLVAFMASASNNANGDNVVSPSKVPLLSRSKQDSSSVSTVFAKSGNDALKTDQAAEEGIARVQSLSQWGGELELGRNGGVAMSESRNGDMKAAKQGAQSLSSRNSSSVSFRGSGSAFKPFPRNSEPTSTLTKDDKDICSDSHGMGNNAKKVEVERAIAAAQPMPNQLIGLMFPQKTGDPAYNEIHGSFSPPISNSPPLMANGLTGAALLSSGNSNSSASGDANHCHRLEALWKYREKRKQRTFERKVLYKSRQKLAKQRPRFKGQFVKQKSL